MRLICEHRHGLVHVFPPAASNFVALRTSRIDGSETTPASDPRAAAFITLQRELAARGESGGLGSLPETFSLLMLADVRPAMSLRLEQPAGTVAPVDDAMNAVPDAALSYLAIAPGHETREICRGPLDDMRRRLMPLSAHHRAMIGAMAGAMALATGSFGHGIDRCHLTAVAALAVPQPLQVTRLLEPHGSMPLPADSESEPLADGGLMSAGAGGSPPRDVCPSPLRGAWGTGSGALVAEVIPALLSLEEELPLAPLASRSPLCGASPAYGGPCDGEPAAFLDSDDRLLDDFLFAD